MGVLEEFLAGLEGFEWDAGNSDKNWRNHDVRQAEAEQVLLNRPVMLASDLKHSQTEPRFFTLGRTDSGRYLAVVFTARRNRVRVISSSADEPGGTKGIWPSRSDVSSRFLSSRLRPPNVSSGRPRLGRLRGLVESLGRVAAQPEAIDRNNLVTAAGTVAQRPEGTCQHTRLTLSIVAQGFRRGPRRGGVACLEEHRDALSRTRLSADAPPAAKGGGEARHWRGSRLNATALGNRDGPAMTSSPRRV